MSRRINISRRDFMNGMALSLAAGTTLSPLEILAMQANVGDTYYPPSLTGLRGSHPGSFEVAHDMAWAGKKFPRPSALTDDIYDLVIVGGGISGLAAAKLYRDRVGSKVRILILDNHDDFGGHAKRNEFDVDGKTLVGCGGSESISSPTSYSAVAKKLLKDLTIDVQRFYEYYERDFYKKYNLRDAMFFDEKTYGVNRVIPSPLWGFFDGPKADAVAEANIRRMPISREGQDALLRLLRGGIDYLDGKSKQEKTELLQRISYIDFLQQYANIPKDLADIIRDTVLSSEGAGWYALSALQSVSYENLGTEELGIDEELDDESNEPYIFHFPDGNASVARALVRDLIPGSMPGKTMESLVTARVRYAELDRESADIRIRLNSTAVDVQHTVQEKQVDVTFVRLGDVYRVRGKHVILACYNNIIPHICVETPQNQVEAIQYATKIPLVVGNVAIRSWRAFAEMGYRHFYSPGDLLFKQMGLDFPVSIGDYKFSSGPDEPIVVQGWYVPTVPGKGLTFRQQNVAGRRLLLEQSFDEFEASIMGQFDAMLGDRGFDAERDIAAITINRWPHGYAYEYNEIGTPDDWGPEKGPHIAGRAQIGRISIANSDASARAYVDGAIDAADR
ncbi:MAG: NAD(P)/FAD-dependent oxidoreductase, partial [Proteobacteria bacterium]|nr:NAD(P)/FAD-dependent oxidoreductase [Pseudomonadota bacterium]